MVKLMPKPAKPLPEYDAWQWRGFLPTSNDQPLGSIVNSQKQMDLLASSIDYVLHFEAWAKKHLKKKNIRYRGNDLVIPDPEYGEKVLKPGMWIVMIPDEYGKPQMNFMTDAQVKSFYDETANTR